jgi:hypothetical protein
MGRSSPLDQVSFRHAKSEPIVDNLSQARQAVILVGFSAFGAEKFLLSNSNV